MFYSYARVLGKRAAKGCRDESGAAAVEMALVLPVLILLVFGIIEFARAWNVRQTLTDAAREGARIAVVNYQMPGMTPQVIEDSVTKVVRAAASRGALNGADVQIAFEGIGVGENARVQLTYLYKPLMTLILPNDITMRTASVMRNE
jgi:Flp pilus assembly pilin Flp